MIRILLICFGVTLGIANAKFLNGQHGIGGRSSAIGSIDDGYNSGPIETIRVIEENSGSGSQYSSLPVDGEYVDTIRVIQDNDSHLSSTSSQNQGTPAFGGHIGTRTVRVIQENHDSGSGPAIDDGHIDTVRIINEHGGNLHNGVGHGLEGRLGDNGGGNVDTVRVIQDDGPLETQAVSSGRPVSGGHVRTIRIIQDNEIPSSSSNIAGALAFKRGSFRSDPAVQTIRVIQDQGVQNQGGSPAINHFNDGHFETIRIIQDDVANHLRSGPTGNGHPVGGHIQTIRLIKGDNGHHLGGSNQINGGDHVGTIRVIKKYSVGQPERYYNAQPGHTHAGHSKIIKIITARNYRRYRH